MRGYNIGEGAHVVNCFSPVDINGAAKNGDVFSMENYAHCTFILTLGVTGAASTVTVQACDDFTPSNTTALAFAVYKEETAAGDTLGAKVAATTSGFATSTNDNITYVIEVDDEELSASGYPNLRISMTDPSASTFASCVAILSGARYGQVQSATAIA